jgi:hypothetical protein
VGIELTWYEELRERHRPDTIRLLLIGESPPDPGAGARRFFYAPTLSHDNLYRGVSAALYGSDPDVDIKNKPAVLERLRHDGVWLIDAVDEPVDKRTTAARRKAIAGHAASLADRTKRLAPTVGVLICHGVVFELVAPALRAAGVTVLHDDPLPFPLGNWRAQFVAGARTALDEAGWWGPQ